MASRTVSRFDNVSTAALADEIGDLDVQAKEIEARLKALKGELAARNEEVATGDRFTVTRSQAVRWTLDLAAAKAKLGEPWCTAHSKAAAVTSFRVSALPVAALAAAA